MYIMDLSPRIFTIKRASVISHLGLNDIFICMVYEEYIQDLNLRLSIQVISTIDQKWIIFFFQNDQQSLLFSFGYIFRELSTFKRNLIIQVQVFFSWLGLTKSEFYQVNIK